MRLTVAYFLPRINAIPLRGLCGIMLSVGFGEPGHARIYMGSWDLNGDGRPQPVHNATSVIEVEHPDGGSVRRYDVGGNWALLGVADTDGKPGLELIVNTGKSIRVIHDRDVRWRDYPIGGNWSLKSIHDVNGQPGDEVVVTTPEGERTIYDAEAVIRPR